MMDNKNYIDRLGRPIKIGDRVATVNSSGSYYYFDFGVVEKYGNKNDAVYVKHDECSKSSRKLVEKIIVISAQEQDNKNTYPELYI